MIFLCLRCEKRSNAPITLGRLFGKFSSLVIMLAKAEKVLDIYRYIGNTRAALLFGVVEKHCFVMYWSIINLTESFEKFE